MVNITEIPLELLNEIIIHIETANSLINLSLTCRKLRASIEDDGFRVFAQRRFPSIQIPPYWKDAVHALTTLSRNWDRRAFVARYLLPELDSARSSDQGGKSKNHQGVIHGRQLRQQTMGYQPVIDCYEEWIGETWSSRKQILAWGAGPSLLVRSKRMGETMTQASETVTAKTWNRHHLDEHCHQSTWAEYKENGLAPGRDDISSVNLLKTAQKPSEDREYVVIGRASGLLDLVGVSTSEPRNDIVAKFETNKRPVRSATINKALSPLIAACLSNCSLSLYQIKATDSRIKPCTELTTIPSGTAGKTWCSRFLRHDCLAVGLGPTKKPIQIYAIRADGLSKSPIREDTFESDANSVYSILPLSSRSLAGGSEGDLFLSGGYDGTIRYQS